MPTMTTKDRQRLGIAGSLLTAVAVGGLFYWMRRRRLIGRPTLNGAQMLRNDHEKVKSFFRRFAETTDPVLKDRIAEDILVELEIHEALEEEIFYPGIRKATGKQDLMDVALAQHQKAAELIVEIQSRRADKKPYDELIEQLATAVREHIAMEESDILPLAERSKANLYQLGARMLARKEELKVRLGPSTAAIHQDLTGQSPSAI